MSSPTYSILGAKYDFKCISCGCKIKKGDNYIETEYNLCLCLKCGLPERKLRPLVKEEAV